MSLYQLRQALGAALLALAATSVCFGQQRPDDAQAQLHAERAQAAIAANQPQIASAELEALLRLRPNNVNARANLGMVLFTQGMYEQALTNFKAALLRSPSLWSATAFAGMCEIRLGQPDQGRSDIESVLAKLTDKPLRTQAGLDLVDSYASAGMEDKAARTIEALQRDDPDNPDLLYAEYRVHSALASAALQKLSRAAPDSARVHQVLGDSMLLQDNYQGAIDQYQQALKIDPRLTGVHLGLGQAMLAQGGKAQSAENEFQAELAVDHGNPDALFQLGDLAYKRGDLDSALRFLTRSLERRPLFPDAHVALAKIYSDRNQDSEAMKHLQSALQSAPDDRTVHYRLAKLYNKSGELVKAAQEFEIARKLGALDNRLMPVTRPQ